MSDESGRVITLSELLPIGGAVLLFVSTLLVVGFVLENLDTGIKIFLDLTSMPEYTGHREVAAFFVVFLPPTLYLIVGVQLWVMAFGE